MTVTIAVVLSLVVILLAVVYALIELRTELLVLRKQVENNHKTCQKAQTRLRTRVFHLEHRA